MDHLRRETGDPDVRRLFDVASALPPILAAHAGGHSIEMIALSSPTVRRPWSRLAVTVSARARRSSPE